MPLIEEERDVALPLDYGILPEEVVYPTPSMLEVLGAAWRRENSLGSALNATPGVSSKVGFKPEYNPFKSLGEEYTPYLHRFARASSDEQVQAIKTQLRREHQDLETLQVSGFPGVAASMGMGLLDPISLIPIGGAAYKTYRQGGGILKGALATAAVAGGAVGINEVALQATQLGRSGEESALNVAGGVLFGGLLGGMGSAWHRAVVKSHGKLDALLGRMEDELTIPPSTYGVQPVFKSAQVSAQVFEEGFKLKDWFDEVVEGLGDIESRLRGLKGVVGAPESLTGLQREVGEEINTLNAELARLNDLAASHLKSPETKPLAGPVLKYMADLTTQVEARQAALGDLQSQGKLLVELADLIQPMKRKLMDEVGGGGELKNPALDLLEPEVVKITEADLLDDMANWRGGGSKTLEVLKSALGVEKWPIFRHQDPLIRTQLSPALSTRMAVQSLAESPLVYEKNKFGLSTKLPVEAKARQFKYGLAMAIKTLDDLFVEYRLGRHAQLGDKLKIEAGDALGGGEGMMTFAEFKAQVAKAMRQGDVSDIPQVVQAAKTFRAQVFDPMLKVAQELDALPKNIEARTAESYLMRVWDVEEIVRRRPEFFDRNLEWLKNKELQRPEDLRRSDVVLKQVVDQIIDRITGTSVGRLAYDLGDLVEGVGGDSVLKVGSAKPLQERVYDIPDRLVEDFLVNDVEHVAKVYERSMAPDLALIENFGSVDLLDVMEKIRAEYGKLLNSEGLTPKERVKLTKRRDQDLLDIVAMRDRIRGTYGMPADPMSVFVRTGKTLRALNHLRLMGGVAISSIPDIARPVMVHGFGRFLNDGLRPLIQNFKGYRLAAQEVKMAGTALDMVLDSRMMALSEMVDDYGRYSQFEQFLDYATHSFGRLSGVSQWNATMKQLSGVMAQSRILDSVGVVGNLVDDGVVAWKVPEQLLEKLDAPLKKEIERLAANFIDPVMARRIAKEFNRYGELLEGGVKLPHTDKWVDRDAVKYFRAAIAREVDRTIVTPGQDKPLWLSTEWGKVLGQFKSFFMSATQRVLLSGLQDRDLAVLNGLVFATGLGVLTTMIKAKQSGRQLSSNPAALIAEGVDRAGVTGWLFDANNIVEKVTRGHIGISAMVGKEPMSRYASRTVLDALVGPSGGLVSEVSKIGGAASSGEWKDSDVRAMRRLIPFQNLFYLRALFDRANEGIESVLGTEQEEPKTE